MAGELKVKCVQMGQGDCTIIKCPDDKIVMIDCGSNRYDYTGQIDSIKSELYTTDFLNNPSNRNYIDLLILTHPDSDHHNKINQVFSDGKWNYVNLGKVYFSSKFNYYYDSWTSSYIDTMIDDENKIRTINFTGPSPTVQHFIKKSGSLSSAVAIKNLSSVMATDYENEEYVDDDGFVRVLEGQFMGDPKYTISILSSNINEYTKQQLKTGGYISNDSEYISSPVNSKSIVVKIEYDDIKIMICGDATMHTEKFLIDRYGNKISNMTIFQVPHHGSANTSSTSKFINHINPKTAVISSAKEDRSFNLPSAQTIYRILACSRLDNDTKRTLYYWVKSGQATANEQVNYYDYIYDYVKCDYSKSIYITGSNGCFIHESYQ